MQLQAASKPRLKPVLPKSSSMHMECVNKNVSYTDTYVSFLYSKSTKSNSYSAKCLTLVFNSLKVELHENMLEIYPFYIHILLYSTMSFYLDFLISCF